MQDLDRTSETPYDTPDSLLKYTRNAILIESEDLEFLHQSLIFSTRNEVVKKVTCLSINDGD